MSVEEPRKKSYANCSCSGWGLQIDLKLPYGICAWCLAELNRYCYTEIIYQTVSCMNHVLNGDVIDNRCNLSLNTKCLGKIFLELYIMGWPTKPTH